MGRIYRFLGMTVGLIVHGSTPRSGSEAYGCDITYGTNNEFGFDYLRDNMAMHPQDYGAARAASTPSSTRSTRS